MQLPIYELKLNPKAEKSGVTAISLVEKPAIRENFIALNEQPILFSIEDKMEVVGPVMIPDMLIPRNDKTGVYQVFFTEETIRQCQEEFFKKEYNNKTTHQHKLTLDKNTVVESWIIEDENHDKSKMYGFNLPKGTWLVKIKINDEKYWNEEVKTGKVKAFSLEGFFDDNYITDIKMKEEKLASMLLEFTLNGMKVHVNDKNELIVTELNSIMPEGEYVTEEKYTISVNEINKVCAITTPEYIEDDEFVYDEELEFSEQKVELGLSKDKKRKMKKSKLNKMAVSLLSLLGFKLAEEEIKEEIKEENTQKLEEPIMEEKIKQEIEFPLAGGEMIIETEKGKFKLVITPYVEPVADVAETQEAVAVPTNEVSTQMSGEIQKMSAQIVALNEMVSKLSKSTPAEPKKFSAHMQEFAGQKKDSATLANESVSRIRERKNK